MGKKKPMKTLTVNDLVRKIGQKIIRGSVVIQGTEKNIKGFMVRKNGLGCDIFEGRTSYGGGVRIIGVKTRKIK